MANEAELVDGAEEGAESSAPRSKKPLIIALIALLVLGGGGYGAWQAFSGKADAKGGKAERKELLPAKYITLDPPFVVNFEAEAAVRFLQVTIGLMTRDLHTETLLKDNDPRLRNDMLMILSGQNYAALSSTDGKEALRQRCLDAVRAIVKEIGGEPDKVEALYFTSFVMQ